MIHAKLGLLASQGKSQKRLILGPMSLLETLERGVTVTRHEMELAAVWQPQDLSREIPSFDPAVVHDMFFGTPHTLWLGGPFPSLGHVPRFPPVPLILGNTRARKAYRDQSGEKKDFFGVCADP